MRVILVGFMTVNVFRTICVFVKMVGLNVFMFQALSVCLETLNKNLVVAIQIS